MVEMSYEAGVAHLGSALSAIDIIEAIFSVKAPSDKFVLSNGHAASALYAVMERYGLLKQPNLDILGTHPDRNVELGIEVSSGSLGQVLPIAVGMALANRERSVFCSISDGECAEGSIWEAIRIAAEEKLTNLKIIVNANGFGGYGDVDTNQLATSLQSFGLNLVEIDGHDIDGLKTALLLRTIKPVIVFAHTRVDELPFLQGLSAHYHKMTKEQYELALQLWSNT